MVRLVIRHEDLLHITSYKKAPVFKHKLIRYYLTKWYYERQGCEVGDLDE